MKFEDVFNKRRLENLLDQLVASDYGTVGTLRSINKIGVYAFFENDKPLYVGRTQKSGLKKRMAQHLGKSHHHASFVFKVARQLLEIPRIGENGYQKEFHTREKLIKDKNFFGTFTDQSNRVRDMALKFVEISSGDEQYIFEYYASKALDTPYNSFEAH